MTLKQIYKKYPTQESCISFLENILWNKEPICPYCQSTYQSAFKNENRYKCNSCSMSYSVTVRTLFHKTRIDLQKWFFVIHLIFNERQIKSLRELGEELSVTKDTVALMLKRIKNCDQEQRIFLLKINDNL